MLESSKKFDLEFSKIPGLNWYPFVGWHYGDRPKVLVLLESHYNQGDIAKIETFESDTDNTRKSLTYYLSELQEKNATYENLKTLLGFSVVHPNVDSIFDHIACYNVVQELMPNAKTHPTNEQYKRGVEILKAIVHILQPDIILLCGRGYRSCYESYDLTRVQPMYIQNLEYPLGRFCFEGIDVLMTTHPSPRTMHKCDIAEWGKALVDASPVFAAFEDSIAKRNADTFSYEEKNEMIEHNLREIFQMIADDNSEYIEAVDGSFGESIYKGEGEYFGLKFKGNDVRIGFNFNHIGYKQLTAGLYFPNGVPDWLRSKAREHGFLCTNNWYYYNITNMWNWRDYEFSKILDGSIAKDLRYIVEDVLIPYYVDHLEGRA